MIILKEIHKVYISKKKKVEALKDVSLEIHKGEIFGIIGSSGAGKSTLLRCMNMLEKPTQGKIYIEGEELSCLKMKKLRLIRQKIGMIFQHFHLMNARTVEQNIAFPMKIKRKFSLANIRKKQYQTLDLYQKKYYTKEEIQAKIDSLLELVDLSDKKGMYPSQLSGGQKQRVAIARALANDPKILLCDEATSALDPQTTISILKLLKEVNQKLGITIVLITHEMDVIKAICDRVAIMEDGKIVEQGSVLEIFTRPCKQVTKDFLCTTSPISKIYELLEQNSSLVSLNPGDCLAKLQYSTVNTGSSIISNISKLFSLEVNIICGTIEILQDQPVGSLVVIFKGQTEKIEEAINALENSQVEVEVMKR